MQLLSVLFCVRANTHTALLGPCTWIQLTNSLRSARSLARPLRVIVVVSIASTHCERILHAIVHSFRIRAKRISIPSTYTHIIQLYWKRFVRFEKRDVLSCFNVDEREEFSTQQHKCRRISTQTFVPVPELFYSDGREKENVVMNSVLCVACNVAWCSYTKRQHVLIKFVCARRPTTVGNIERTVNVDVDGSCIHHWIFYCTAPLHFTNLP